MIANLGRDRTAAASLEFAVAGTTILILLLAIFDIGLLFVDQRGVDFGANKAARWAAVNSASLTNANVLTQFKSATASSLGTNNQNCEAYTSGASIPAGTNCYITVALSSGATVGGLVTITATYNWSPLSALTGLTAATLQSTVALTIQN